MDTYNRILKEQQERYALQREKDKARGEALYALNIAPLNNAYLLSREEN